MDAVIPAAKKKESLFPFSETLSTALMPVKGEALIKQNIRKLKDCGVDKIHVVVNHKSDRFEEIFEERPDVNLVYQEELSGTSDALRTCSFIEEDFIVLNGDVIISENDISRLIQSHKNDMTLLATNEDKARKFGVLSIVNDEIKSLDEKPETPENTLVNSGIYLFKPSIFEVLKDSEKNDLTEVISENLENLKCNFCLIEDYWVDIDSLKKLGMADKILRQQDLDSGVSKTAKISEKAYVEDSVEIRSNVKIEANASVKGDSIIHSGSIVKSNTVVEDSSISADSVLENCHIQNSLVFPETLLILL